MELTNSTVQAVASNQNVLYDTTAVASNKKCIVHREGSGLVTLRGITNSQSNARFLVYFNANIAIPTGGTVGGVSLAIAIDGEPVSSSAMVSTPDGTLEYNNVSSAVFVTVPKGCCETISVENTSTQAISVSNPNLIVVRVA